MLFCVTVLWCLYSTTRHSATCAKNTFMLQFWCGLLCCASAQVTSLGLLLRLLYCNWWVILLVLCCLSSSSSSCELYFAFMLSCFHASILVYCASTQVASRGLLLRLASPSNSPSNPSMQHSSNSNPRHYLFIIKTWFSEIKKVTRHIQWNSPSSSTPNHPQYDILQTLPEIYFICHTTREVRRWITMQWRCPDIYDND